MTGFPCASTWRAYAPEAERALKKVSGIWYAVLALTLLLLAAGGGRAWLRAASGELFLPVGNAVAWVRGRVAPRLGALLRAQEALDRARALEDENARLRIDALLLEQVSAENAALRRQAGAAPRGAPRMERCVVISRGGAAGWWRSLRLNKGSSSGIGVGDAVVAPDGLVGVVRDVSASTADVRLITDPSSRVACALETAPGAPPARGILRGAGWGSRGSDVSEFLFVAEPMRLEYLDRDAPPAPCATGAPPARARVVTSGLGGAIPGGLPVGWLLDSSVEPNGLYRTGSVLPAVDFAGLATLFVLVGTGEAP